jgi:hypothetical protein
MLPLPIKANAQGCSRPEASTAGLIVGPTTWFVGVFDNMLIAVCAIDSLVLRPVINTKLSALNHEYNTFIGLPLYLVYLEFFKYSVESLKFAKRPY